MESKIEKLQRFISKSPKDPFPRYGLGMEYKASGMSEEALACFGDLVEHSPDYLAAYYQFGTLLIETGQDERAKSILARGIEIASEQGNSHSREELEAALAQLDDDE